MKRIAISLTGDRVSQFRDCEKVCIVNIANRHVISRQFIDNPANLPEFMPDFLTVKYVDCIVTGGIEEKVSEILSADGINVITGIKGSAEEVIDAFINGNLAYPDKKLPVECKNLEALC